jgi:hypothetical protein
MEDGAINAASPEGAGVLGRRRVLCKRKTPVAKISKPMKRTVGAIRQQGLKLGIPLGHRR